MSFEFEITESKKIKGVMIIKPSISKDRRGTIWTSFLNEQLDKILPDGLYFKHDKFSQSCRNVLRGIHGDNKSWKLVTSVYGEIHQIVVDCRKDSPTYLHWEKFIINKDNQQLILIPPNMGNAYYVNSQDAVYHYKLAYDGDYIDAVDQFTLEWNDPKIRIDWISDNPILSDRDLRKEKMNKKIVQVMPNIDESELQYVTESISKKWLTEGPNCEAFLEHIKEFTGSKYAVLAPNGTLGLFLGLLALDIPRGSEIIIPSFTFFASASSAVFAGLKPVFIDVDEKTFNIDFNKLESLITTKTKAIMPVHIYGHSANMDKIMAIAEKYNLRVIEDAAQAYGVRYNGKHCGTFGDISMISFFADKTITMGEGAVVLTQDETLYKKLLLLRNQGRPNSGTFIHPSLGMNFRVTDLQAGIGLSQADKFPNVLEKKLLNYSVYKDNLMGIGDLEFLEVEKGSTFVPFRFFLKTQYKDELIKYLENKNIQTRSFFYPMHNQPPLKEFVLDKQTFNISEILYNTGICLPLHTYLEKDDIVYICSAIIEFFRYKI